MAASLNKVQIIGHLGQDPDVRYFPDGTASANVSIATNEVWRDKASGERRERTDWHRAVLHGRVAEVARDYLRKGALVYLDGQLRTRKYQDGHGQDRYVTEIVVGLSGTLKMLDRRPDEADQGAPAGSGASASPDAYAAASGGSSAARRTPPATQAAPRQQNASAAFQAPASDIPFDDDIPF